MWYRRCFKRVFDLVGALVLLAGLSPLLLLVSAGCAAVFRGRVVFAQQRIGFGCKAFKMWKLRTMNDRRDEHGALLDDRARTTRYGVFLRRTSLDELPQLFHVVAGRMSLVGPRPLLPEHVAGCTPAENRRHSVRPGLTGLAQVRGRSSIPFSSRFRYDVWYAGRIGFALDMFILLGTVRQVLCPRASGRR